MTTPVGSGAVDNTPDTGGSVSYSASGWGGAQYEDAPDVAQGFMHAPGSTQRTTVLDGPATMKVNKVDDKSSKKNHKK
jgi:hypothetical protein